MFMEIKILGGEKEIGGNKILLEHKGTRILLDFGMSFKQLGLYFSEFLQPRKCNGLGDLFEMGLLPKIEGIYREDYLNHTGLPKEERSVDALFLSHAHADHAQYIHFLRPDIPIYCLEPTKIILKCLEETGSGGFCDLVTACESFTLYKNKKGEMSRVTRKNRDYVRERQYSLMKPGERIKIGSLEIEMAPVDHSLPGACGYIVYSDEGNLVYTGDLRFHGSNRDLSLDFVKKAKGAKPKWLLCEGTRIDDEESFSEGEVRDEISRLISEAEGLVFVEHPIRDTDRVKSIFEASKANGRDFVVNLKLAYLIRELGGLAPFSLDDVRILLPKKNWGFVCKDGADCKQVEQDYAVWEREFLGMKNSITAKDISENPEKYVVSMNMFEIGQLADIRPKGAIWIKSSCEPFCEEMELDEERKKNWLRRFGIADFFAHASGHASGKEIMEMIGEIGPEILIPIHTEHPEMFKSK